MDKKGLINRGESRHTINLTTKQVIIDTDSGIDDIISIAVALRHEKTRLRAITVVEGNTSLKQGLLNLCSLLDINILNDRKVPIYPGCDKPIIQEFNRDKPFTSSSSFHTFQSYSLPERNRIEHHVEKEHAVLALLRMVNKEPNELTIICLGPLTNIALAIRLDPFFLSKVKGIVVMGGCLYGKGNSTRVTEFAFNYDPEAAHILFTASKLYAMENPHCTQPKLTVVPWEVAVEQGLDWSFYDYLIHTPPITKFTNIIKELSSIKELLFRNSHETILSLSSTNGRSGSGSSSGDGYSGNGYSGSGYTGSGLSGFEHDSSNSSNNGIMDDKTNMGCCNSNSNSNSNSNKNNNNGNSNSNGNHNHNSSNINNSNSNNSSNNNSNSNSHGNKYKNGNNSGNGIVNGPQTSNTVLEYQINATKFIMCDLYTLVCAIEPDIVINEYQDLDVEIELHGKYSRGMTCFDWLGSSQHLLNARVVMKVNKDIIKSILVNSFKQEEKPITSSSSSKTKTKTTATTTSTSKSLLLPLPPSSSPSTNTNTTTTTTPKSTPTSTTIPSSSSSTTNTNTTLIKSNTAAATTTTTTYIMNSLDDDPSNFSFDDELESSNNNNYYNNSYNKKYMMMMNSKL